MVYAEINIIIPKDRNMTNLIRFLSYKIETMDGNCGTAVPYIEYLTAKTI
jgi:hypothetical protein